MATCLIIPAPIRSHVIPSFYLASLFSKHYKVIYACYKGELDELVKSNGFTNRIIKSERFALGFDPIESWQKHGKKISFGFFVSAITNSLTMAIYKKRKAELSKLIIEIKANLVFIDIFSSTDFLIIKLSFPNIKIAFFNPMLNTYNSKDYPNVRGELYADIEKNTTLLSSIKNISSPRSFLAKVTGFDPTWQLNKVYRSNPILNSYPIDKMNTVVKLFKNVPEIILAPKELEFSENIFKNNQFYLGLCQTIQRKDTLVDKEYYSKIDKILKNKSQKNAHLIYVSFGSYFSSINEHKYIIAFCLFLIKAFQNKSTIFVISVKQEIFEEISKYAAIPLNFFFFTRVPQLEILQKADLFITHGGLGSIKEAIFFQVPMLVYPLDLNWDQRGNAQKIEFHKIGISGDFKKDGLVEIENKIFKIINDPIYNQNIKDLHDKCNAIEYSTMNYRSILEFIKL